ncbi:reverse transcriptase [Gossypium australe]|uniref:Reverse transcriptase n=1 Tax=Gossypium australe TaxID=47621 RepID=A0A5B6UZU1_9ROSI|nr:reverse transcriptase [Gossypium australe]
MTLFSIPIIALVDSGSMHSYIYSKIIRKRDIPVEELDVGLPFRESDVILGMDWFTEHNASLKCRARQLKLHGLDETRVLVTNEISEFSSCVIFATVARRLISRGCEAFLVCVVDTRVQSPALEDLRAVREFLDVFLKELSGLP